MKKAIVVLLALLAGAALAVPLASQDAAGAGTTTVITTCPPGQGAPYCEITTQTIPDETTTTTTSTTGTGTGGGSTTTTPSENPPEPVAGETVVAGKITGTVLVRIAGTDTFVEVAPGQPIPLGSQIDVTHGEIELASAPDANGNVQTAVFAGGTFTVTQIRVTTTSRRLAATAAAKKKVTLITRLTLVDKRPANCGRATTRAKKPPVPHLWGNGKGHFQTKGAYSAATVSGTHWYVGNRCDGTYTRVARGVVEVRDHTLHKTVTVRAPHVYLARPPKKPKKH